MVEESVIEECIGSWDGERLGSSVGGSCGSDQDAGLISSLTSQAREVERVLSVLNVRDCILPKLNNVEITNANSISASVLLGDERERRCLTCRIVGEDNDDLLHNSQWHALKEHLVSKDLCVGS